MLRVVPKFQSDLMRWKHANRGMLTHVAGIAGVSRMTVSAVLRQKYYSQGGVIEGLLAYLDAPGMKQRQLEAEAKQKGSAWTRKEKRRLTLKLKRLQESKRKTKAA